MNSKVRFVDGVWGALVYACCPLCSWRGRKRSASGSRHTKAREILELSHRESRAHLEHKHFDPAPAATPDLPPTERQT